MGRKKTNLTLKKEETSIVPKDLDEIKLKFLALYSDPLDTSTDKELAEKLDIPVSLVSSFKTDTELASIGWSKFQPAFQNIRIPLMKDLIRQALVHKSQKATEKLLEILGILQGKGNTTVNVFSMNTSTGLVTQTLEKLTDQELDKEILRLQESIAVDDIVYLDGQVESTKEIIDVAYEELKVDSDLDRQDKVRSSRVGMDTKTEEREVVPVLIGKTKKNGAE